MKLKKFTLLAVAAFAGFQTSVWAQSVAVDLGEAAGYGVLAGSTITNTGSTFIFGDIGLSPGTSITGFPTPGTVAGTIHIGDASAIQAKSDAVTVYTALAGETFTSSLTGQDLGTMTLTPGVYGFSATAQLTGMLILDAQGNSNARFDFLIGSTLTTVSSSSIVLINSAQASNVYWQVGSSATLGTNSEFFGTILANQSITLGTGTTLSGMAYALGAAVTLDSNTITLSTSAVPEPATASLLIAGLLALVVGARKFRWHRC